MGVYTGCRTFGSLANEKGLVLMTGDGVQAKVLCPKCKKDMAIRPGAVFRCAEKECAYWRVYWAGQSVMDDK